MKAVEISKPEKLGLRSKPLVVQGIQQHHLHELMLELDVTVNGVVLRLPVGCVIAIHGGGSGGLVGSLASDVDFLALNGQGYRASKGMQFAVSRQPRVA